MSENISLLRIEDGRLCWLRSDVDIPTLRKRLESDGGSVCAYRNHAKDVRVFQPLAPGILKLQRNLKTSFDPAGIFNVGRLYPGW